MGLRLSEAAGELDKWLGSYQLACDAAVVYPADYRVPHGIAPPLRAPSAGSGEHHLTMYFSPRSPYSQLAVARFFAIARFHGVAAEVRLVLPMVMRPEPLAVATVKRA